jgi:signal transduction histidine kinase
MTTSLSGSGSSEHQEAGAHAADFLQKLACATGTSSGLRGSSTAQTVANRALAHARSRFPATDFRLVCGSAGRFSCNTEEIVNAVVSALENAAEAQEGSAKPIVVRVAAEDARVLIEVADSGPGIDRRAARRLFNPFFSTKPGHYGLGLYFARMNVERNDGVIDVAPGEAGGTLARLAFPRIGAGIGPGEES